MKRKRKYIPLKQKLAAALACLLPQMRRDELRRLNARADDVLSLFEWDHVVLHALSGSDKWWNLDPKYVAAHREKSRQDTSIVAKVKRLQDAAGAVADKPKPKSVGKHRAAKRRTTARPARSWGIPGLRRKVNGDVVCT